MFGGPVEPPKIVKRSRPKETIRDIQLPTFTPGVYGHIGREPNTDYHVRLLHYKQRMQNFDDAFLASEAKRLTKNAIEEKYDKHTEVKTIQRLVQERFKEKVQKYDASIEERRKKLRKLLCEDEQEFIRETIDAAQKGVDNRMSDMKVQAEILKAKREAERQQIVEEKRTQQFMNSCQELRPVLIKTNLLDTKNTQLQQIKENEMRKEAERELDSMWYNAMVKEIEHKMERETQDMLRQNKQMKETMEIWDKQIEGKRLLKEEEEKVAADDKLEMLRLQEQLRREQIEALDAKRRKRDQVAKELREQLRIQEQFIAQRKKEEDALNAALNRLAEEELKREREKIQNTTLVARRETAIYRKHLEELEEERKREEQQLNDLLKEHKTAIDRKQEEAQCKLKRARQELQKSVLEGRAQQLEYKKQEAENQLKLKEAENELIRMACETNERLQAEADRLQAEQVRQYREDLKKQIEHNNEKRRLEREQLQLDLKAGLEEEEKRRKRVQEIIQLRLDSDEYHHPFRRIIEKPTCPCPSGRQQQ